MNKCNIEPLRQPLKTGEFFTGFINTRNAGKCHLFFILDGTITICGKRGASSNWARVKKKDNDFMILLPDTLSIYKPFDETVIQDHELQSFCKLCLKKLI